MLNRDLREDLIKKIGKLSLMKIFYKIMDRILSRQFR